MGLDERGKAMGTEAEPLGGDMTEPGNHTRQRAAKG
jgi:hypothetical protein